LKEVSFYRQRRNVEQEHVRQRAEGAGQQALRGQKLRRGHRMLHKSCHEEPFGSSLLHQQSPLLSQSETLAPGHPGRQAGPGERP